MSQSNMLMTRDEFRQAVLTRDWQKCVNCGAPGQDAHHIIERRLFPDGGYYLDNGATVCGACHLMAEATTLSCETLRNKAGIETVVLPPHLYPDETYDKWGNVITPNGQRLRGELFDDESVQKVLAPVLAHFTNRVKYPRTWHLPWSPGATKDDRVLTGTDMWQGSEVVITEKMDGENTTMYSDYLHARSIDYSPHPSRDRIRAIHASLAHEIPNGWRICGENLTAVHSIHYDILPGYFMVFGVWDRQTCMSWDDTITYATLLNLPMVPVLYRGQWDEERCRSICQILDTNVKEGLVVRPAGEFTYRNFKQLVGKYVRASHVQTHGHWMRSRLEYNEVV